jgi:hypothetical protein
MSIPNTTNAANVGATIHTAFSWCNQKAQAAATGALKVARAVGGFFMNTATTAWNGTKSVCCTSWNVTKTVSARVTETIQTIGCHILHGTKVTGNAVCAAARKIASATSSTLSRISHFACHAATRAKDVLACGFCSTRTFVAAHRGASGIILGVVLCALSLYAYQRAAYGQPIVI